MKQIKDSEGYQLLVDDSDECAYRIGWADPDSGEINLHVGETTQPKDAPAQPDKWLAWIAHRVANQSAEGRESDGSFYWPTVRAARQALAAISLAVQSGKPWPEWAIKAKAAGWKAPKRWKL